MRDMPIDRAQELAMMQATIERLIPNPESAAKQFRAVRLLCARRWQSLPNWALAKEVYTVGSTYAHAICQRMSIDPDAKTAEIASGIEARRAVAGITASVADESPGPL